MTTPTLSTTRLVLVALDTRQLAARLECDDFSLDLAGLGPVRFGPEHPGDLMRMYPLLLLATPHPGQVQGTWTIVERAARQAVGSIGVKGQPHAGAVEIGYEVVPAARGRGFASEAVRVVCAALLTGEVGLDAPVHAVQAETRPDNLASQAVLRGCGFTCVAEPHDQRDGPLLHWELRDCP